MIGGEKIGLKNMQRKKIRMEIKISKNFQILDLFRNSYSEMQSSPLSRLKSLPSSFKSISESLEAVSSQVSSQVSSL